MKLIRFIKNKKIAILGFGKEGKSSYSYIRKHLPDKYLAIHDKEFIDIHDENTALISGDNYLQNLKDYDLILKTPGICLTQISDSIEPEKIYSQTALFLQFYRNQTIGITGTKGKSTIASLIAHILQNTNKKVILAGNIGIPFFDMIDKIDKQTLVVAELSAHQLEFVRHSPHIAVLLNLYQEHLDHFNSFSSYVQAKLNITKYQSEKDILVYNQEDVQIINLLHSHHLICKFEPFSNRIKYHAAFVTCKLLGISDNEADRAWASFIPLEHRQEFVREKHGIRFYNDSIATVPEATIYALETLKEVDTLLLGGFDRGIDYTILYKYLHENPVNNIVFMGPAGKRMITEWITKVQSLQNGEGINHIFENDMQKIILFAITHTQKRKICLLSPAAASYDRYTHFEERGKIFKQCVLQPFSLKTFHSFKIEVTCNEFICINREEEYDYLFDKKIFNTHFLILGGGSNILFTKDYDGVIIHINTKGIQRVKKNDKFVEIEVKAGENWDDFVAFCVKNNYYGVENLAGIPGKVGSAPVQNIGAYGEEVKNVIKEVHVREIATEKALIFSNKMCQFGYRNSIFKSAQKNKYLITAVVFRLSTIENYNLSYQALKDELPIYPNVTLEWVRNKIYEIRNRKLPDREQTGSAGSFFKNPVILKTQFKKLQEKYIQLFHFEEDEEHVKLAAAQLIELSGWKGYRKGDAGVYPFQPLVLVNYGNATGQEIENLSKQILQSVFDNFGIKLESEVNIIPANH